MAYRKNRNNIIDELMDDTTMSEESIASSDQWMTMDKQRKIARHLMEVTGDITPDIKNKDRNGIKNIVRN